MRACVSALVLVAVVCVGSSCRSTPEVHQESVIESTDELKGRESESHGTTVGEAESETEPNAEPEGLVDTFSHVRVDQARGIVEFDAWVPIDCHDPRTPDVWLEQIVCIADTMEHESLVVSLAKPSEVHAAMLLIGLEPGQPGSYRWDGQRVVGVPPEGNGVGLQFIHVDEAGNEIVSDPLEWAVDVTGKRTLADHMRDRQAFVFSGSRFVAYNGPRVYDADFSGTLIGLATFGGETIALSEVISHEAMYEEPVWLANANVVPKYGTEIRVRVTKLVK